MPWYSIHPRRDEGTHTQMWSHSRWQILTDPFHHGSHASLSLHRYHSSATCLCLTAHLTQTTHPSSSHGLTTACPALLGACHKPQLSRGCSSENHFPENPQILKLPCRHKPTSSRAWTPREHLTLHSHRQAQAHPLPPSQCQTQPRAARAREAPSEQENPNRIGTEYKGWPTPLFLFPLLPSLPQAS